MERIQEKVRGLFYYHGMFCASHPFAIISLVITIAFITCYPLSKIPLPGNAPLKYTTSLEEYQVPPSAPPPSNTEEPKLPRWYMGAPEAYIQQIVIKSVVSPWNLQKHIQTDAFRGPLQQAFDIVEQINNFKYKERNKEYTVSELCLHVAETKSKHHVKGILPEYNCLTVSPANLWNKDKSRFQLDGDIMKTIFKKYSPPMHSAPYLKDILFGVSHQDSGVKKYFVRNRQRIITYAITLVFKEYNPRFIQALKTHLQSIYPGSLSSNTTKDDHISHVYYKDLNYFVEYTPLLVTYAVLFMYIYFSVRKIEMVKSKWGLAFSAVVTVIASLLMSVSICLMFGLTPSLNGSEIFPYLVVIIGLENVLVVTKSVVSTPVYLDVKLRVAQGISKEGWYIFKYMVTELLILAVGFLTFVPAIQEFCAFAVVGLLTDFFLQMFFFTTVLSIDIRRMELSDLHKQDVHQVLHDQVDGSNRDMGLGYGSVKGKNLSYMKMSNLKTPSPIRISTGSMYSSRRSPSPTLGSISGDRFMYDPTPTNLPRRVKFLNFWARTRVVQKAVMICVVIWILLIVYKAGIVAFLAHSNGTVFEEEIGTTNVDPSLLAHMEKLASKNGEFKDYHGDKSIELQDDDLHGFKPQLQNNEINGNIKKVVDSIHTHPPQNLAFDVEGDSHVSEGHVGKMLLHKDKETWQKLSYNHWPTLFGYYNKSLQGKYITILPSIPLSIIVSGEGAIKERHPNEHKLVSHLSKYYNNAANMYYGRIPENGENESYTVGPNQSVSLLLMMKKMSVYPRNTVELILTILCCLASVVLFVYFMVYLYKCMCPKNYSQWRASWYKSKKGKKGYYKQIRETLPLNLEGHKQEIECITTDGPLVISTCLGGYIKVWDANSADCITTIIRRSIPPPPMMRNPIPGRNINDSDADLYAEFHGDDPHKRSFPGFSESPNEKFNPIGTMSDLYTKRTSLEQSPIENIIHLTNKQQPSSFNQSHIENISHLTGQHRSSWGQSPIDNISHLTKQHSPLDNINHLTRQHSLTSTQIPLTSPTLIKAKHTRFKSADLSQFRFEDIGPDLSSTIDTDFISLAKEQKERQALQKQLQHEKSYEKQDSSQAESNILLSPSTPSYSSQGDDSADYHDKSSSFSLTTPSVDQKRIDTSNNSFSDSPNQYRASASNTSSNEHIPISIKANVTPSQPLNIPQSSTDVNRNSASLTGYNFSQFVEPYYREHAEFVIKQKAYIDAKRIRSASRSNDMGVDRSRSYSLGESPTDREPPHIDENFEGAPAVWCLACHQNLIIAGCGNGRIEFWDGLSGQLKCHFSDNKVGVTAICFVGNKITAARLNGTIDFLEIETFINLNKHTTSTVKTSLHNRGHVRQPSNSSLGGGDMKVWDDVIHCNLVTTAKAHQRPINLLQSEGGRVVSASQDHTLKVYRLEDSLCLYTLYGHNGSVSALHLDRSAPLAAASGAEDGTVRLWDLFTGACVHKLHGHTATVTNLTCTPAYVISVAVDDRLCIWERGKGALLHWVQMDAGFCNSVAMLTSNLMVSGGQGCLYLWDVCKGEILRSVQLGDHSVFVKQIHVIANAAVVCDYGNELRVVHFPSVLEKTD